MTTARRVRALAAVTVLAILAVLVTATPASAEDRHAKQWYLNALHVPDAQKLSTGKGVTVAVVDSGIDAGHPDLAGHVLHGIDEGDFNLAKYGWKDIDGHGTEMAGIIAAQGGGPSHIYGIAPGADILPVRVLDDPGPEMMVKAIRWATDHGAQVINISLSSGIRPGDARWAPEAAAVGYALQHNVVVVASAGNNPQTGPDITAPGNIPGVIAVTGTTEAGIFWSGSATGKQAGLAAPATNIPKIVSREVAADRDTGTLVRTNGYNDGSSGTSDSTAVVSAVAALVRARYPKLDAANVVNRLIATADHKGPAGRNAQYGFGLVDPVKALTADVPPVSANPLGDPSSQGSKPSATHAAAAPASSDGTTSTVLIAGIIIVVLAGLVIVLAVASRARNRRRRATGQPTALPPYGQPPSPLH